MPGRQAKHRRRGARPMTGLEVRAAKLAEEALPCANAIEPDAPCCVDDAGHRTHCPVSLRPAVAEAIAAWGRSERRRALEEAADYLEMHGESLDTDHFDYPTWLRERAALLAQEEAADGDE